MKLIPGNDIHLELAPNIGELTIKDRQELTSWLRNCEAKMGEEFTIEKLDQVFELGMMIISIQADRHKREAELPRVDWFDLGSETVI